SPRPHPALVNEKALIRAHRRQGGCHAKSCQWPGKIAAPHAKALVAYPLEGFFLPLEAHAEAGEGKLAAGILARPLGLQGRQAGVAVETVGVGDEGPDLVRRRIERPRPPVIAFGKRHLLEPTSTTGSPPRNRPFFSSSIRTVSSDE